MFWKSKKIIPAGASEKIEIAKRMREAGKGRGDGDLRDKPKAESQLAAVIGVIVISMVLAMLVTDDPSSGLARYHFTGIHLVDSILTGSTIPHIMGDPDIDRLIVVLVRAAALFLATGFIPAVTFLSGQLFSDRVRPLYVCWLIIALLPAIYYLPLGGIWQSLKEIAKGF